MKKNIVKILAVILCSVCFVTYKFYDATNVEDTKTNTIKPNNNMLSMMLETSAGSGKYEVSSLNTWPTDGYIFNSELSKCENGSAITWDDTNKQVIYNSKVTDKCYIYFDLIPIISLTEYVISQYTGTQGENGLYYHDSNLANGAGDNSYRYAGANPNNYICLNSDEKPCPDNNLYRIIGAFGEDNHGVAEQQLVKVIKNTSIGNIAWNTTTSNNWSNASLNKTLNSTFKTENLSEIEDKIAEVTWKISGHNINGVTANAFYIAEIANATNTYQEKIGLIYASDYGFAPEQIYWTVKLSDYGFSVQKRDWLYLSSFEWFLSPYSSSNNAWYIGTGGSVNGNAVTNTNSVRPSFYLTSNVVYVSGTGTSTDPIRVK